MSSRDFIPRGGTPLNDALGQAIQRTGQRLSAMKEEDRPSKVVFIVLTDGEENASIGWTKEQVRKAVKHQEEKYNWQFIFLGSGIDAFNEGFSVGINPLYTANVNRTKINESLMYATSHINSYRVSGRSADLSFSSSELKDMEEE